MNKETEYTEKVLQDWGRFVGVDKASGSDTTVFHPDVKFYILAEAFRHAEWFARHIHLPRKQFKWIDQPSDLHGASGIVVYYETWARHNRAHEINSLVNILKEHGHVKIYTSDEIENLLGLHP